MGKGTIKTKAMTMAVAMSMVAGLCPSTVFAASGRCSCSRMELIQERQHVV